MEPDPTQDEPADADHVDAEVPADLLELFEVLEYEAGR